jgi:hypothetical protein
VGAFANLDGDALLRSCGRRNGLPLTFAGNEKGPGNAEPK